MSSGLSRRTLLTGACALTAAGAAGCRADPGAAAGPPAPLGPATAVPVGGGTVFADRQVVVTQPEAGVFHAFSAVCPHQGCTVDEVADDLIVCPCHGSAFAVADGSVVRGPADRPLARREVSVEGGSLTLR